MIDAVVFSENILSKNIELIKKIEGSIILGLSRYSLEQPEDIAKEIEERFHLSPLESKSSVFRRTYGPLLLTLDSGVVIGFGSVESQGSVSAWLERPEDGKVYGESSIMGDEDFFPIDASDSIYSEKTILELLGKRVILAKIIRNEELYSTMGVASEVGLSLIFENDQEIIISHNISDNVDDFAIIFRNEIRSNIIGELREISIMQA